MTVTDLDKSLLHQIMISLGEFRGRRPSRLMTTQDLRRKGMPGHETGGLERLLVHIRFLEQSGYLETKDVGVHKELELTAQGHVFVQPELAEFGRVSLLPEVVRSLENKIQVLTYPKAEKDGMVYRLRDAVAKGTPDFIAEVVVKIAGKIMSGA